VGNRDIFFDVIPGPTLARPAFQGAYKYSSFVNCLPSGVSGQLPIKRVPSIPSCRDEAPFEAMDILYFLEKRFVLMRDSLEAEALFNF
jgi:hypothetical protein